MPISRQHAYVVERIVQVLQDRGLGKTAAATAGKEVQSPGVLRSSASSAWRMGVSTPRPKSNTPTAGGAKVKGTPPAKPPSKTAYFADVIKTLNNPQRGFRQAKMDS